MEKSIESVWQNGFLDADELKVPKIKNLYNRKSTLVIGKIKKTHKLHLLLREISATIWVVILALSGHITTAIVTGTLFRLMNNYYNSILKPLKLINKSKNSYDYLTTFRNKLHEITTKKLLFMGIICPLIYILFMYIFYNELGTYEKNIKNLFGTLNNGSILLYSYIVISITMFLIAYLSEKAIYRNSLKKLDEIIADMEELRT